MNLSSSSRRFLLVLLLLNLLLFEDSIAYGSRVAKNRRNTDNHEGAEEESRRLLIRSPAAPEDDDSSAAASREDADGGKQQRNSDGAAGDAAKKPKAGELYLPEGYNKFEIPPMVDDERTLIHVYFNIRSIGEIDESNEEITFETDVIISWLDGVLMNAGLEALFKEDDVNFDFEQSVKVLDPVFLRNIWKPDIFIENLADVKQPNLMGTPPASLKMLSLGEIIYTARLKLKVECDFDYTYYPADTQECAVTLRSYSHVSSKLSIAWWKPIGVYLLHPEDDNYDLAVGKLRRFQLLPFVQLGQAGLSKPQNETFDAIQFTILARRRLSYHLLQTYVPSTIYIAITWLCFLVPKKMIEARIAIAMTTLLTLTAMFGAVRESTPLVSYTKAIDVWMVACITFVFGVLLEFSILLWTESANEADEEEHLEQQRKESSQQVADSPEELLATSTTLPKADDHMVQVVQGGRNSAAAKAQPILSKRRKIRNYILRYATSGITFFEEFAFLIILNLFMVFLLLYWSWLLINSNYFEWHVNSTHNNNKDYEPAAGDGGKVRGEIELNELGLFIE